MFDVFVCTTLSLWGLVYKLYIVRVKESCNRPISVKSSGESRPASELASGSFTFGGSGGILSQRRQRRPTGERHAPANDNQIGQRYKDSPMQREGELESGVGGGTGRLPQGGHGDGGMATVLPHVAGSAGAAAAVAAGATGGAPSTTRGAGSWWRTREVARGRPQRRRDGDVLPHVAGSAGAAAAVAAGATGAAPSTTRGAGSWRRTREVARGRPQRPWDGDVLPHVAGSAGAAAAVAAGATGGAPSTTRGAGASAGGSAADDEAPDGRATELAGEGVGAGSAGEARSK